MDNKLFDKLRPKSFHNSIQQNLKRVCQNVKINGGWVNVEKCPICGSKKKKIWQIKNKIPIYINIHK